MKISHVTTRVLSTPADNPLVVGLPAPPPFIVSTLSLVRLAGTQSWPLPASHCTVFSDSGSLRSGSLPPTATLAEASRILEDHFGRVAATSELNRLLYLDLKLTIGDNDLFKVTCTAELAGVGVRFPFLALPLVEFTGTLPPTFKVRGLEKRYLFKRAFRNLLPPETLAKRKHGFGVPTAEWLRTHPGIRQMARDVLLGAETAARGYFRRGALERLFAQHAADPTPFYGDILWTILMLELWHRRHGVSRATT